MPESNIPADSAPAAAPAPAPAPDQSGYSVVLDYSTDRIVDDIRRDSGREDLPPGLRAAVVAQLESLQQRLGVPVDMTPPAQAADSGPPPTALTPVAESVSATERVNYEPPPPPPQPEPAPPPQVDLAEELRRATARYETLQGKYNAETAALRAELAKLQLQLQSLLPQAQSQFASQPQPQPQVPPQSAPDRAAVELDPAVIKQQLGAKYGQVFDEADIDMIAEAAATATRLAAEAMERKVQERLTPIASQVQAMRIQAVEAQLDSAIPGWRAIVAAPEFRLWLASPDEFSGVPRQTILAQAIEAGDVARVGRVIDTYQRLTQTAQSAEPARTPQPTVDQTAAPAPSAPPPAPPRPAPSMARPVVTAPPSPRAAVVAQPVANAGSRFYGPQDVTEVLRAVKAGVPSHEVQRRLDELHMAILEGRFVPQ